MNPQPPISRGEPSAWRAWWALVWLSWQRQARARQMVWIALTLLAFSVALVAFFTYQGRWGMSHWRSPRRYGPTFVQWNDNLQVLTAMLRRPPAAPSGEAAVFGAVRTIITPNLRDV